MTLKHTQIDPTTANIPLIALLVSLNLIVIVCDLAEVDQVYHYSIFGLLGFSAAARFAHLGYMHPRAVSPPVRRIALKYFALGVALIVTGFGVSPIVVVRHSI